MAEKQIYLEVKTYRTLAERLIELVEQGRREPVFDPQSQVIEALGDAGIWPECIDGDD